GRAVPRAGARRRFFLDRTDDRDSYARHRLRGGGDECGERPLRIDGAASDELAVLDPDRDLARHRVDVAEEHDVRRPIADLADGIARIVDRRSESPLAHARDEPFDRITLLA